MNDFALGASMAMRRAYTRDSDSGVKFSSSVAARRQSAGHFSQRRGGEGESDTAGLRPFHHESERGNVVDVVSAKVFADSHHARAARLPENVNYAVKSGEGEAPDEILTDSLEGLAWLVPPTLWRRYAR